MFSQMILAFLFVTAAVAAPASYMSDGATPSIIKLNSNVSCTNVNSPSVPPTPSPSVILLNNPSPPQPSASNPYAGYAAAPQPSGSPPIINLNAPAASPSIIKLNKRQFTATSTSTFSFGGILPSSVAPPIPPAAPTTSSSSSFSSGGVLSTPPPTPASTVLPNGISAFTSTGQDGIKTVFLLSTATVTVTGSACSSTPVFNPALTTNSSPPALVLPTVSPSSSFLGANAAPVALTAPVSSPSVINLNTPSATTTPATGFSFISAPASSITPSPFPV